MKFLARLFFRAVFAPFVWFAYRIRKIGGENVPAHGGVLLLGNHVSYIDSFILYLASPRPVRFVVLEDYLKVKPIAWFLRLFGAIPIRPAKAKEAIVRTVEALQAGDVVCLFPEGGLTRLGVTTEFKKGFELIARKAGCPIVPVYMDGLFESIFSFERDRYFKKRPKRLVCPIRVVFGPPIPAEKAAAEGLRLAVWESSVEAFAARREFKRGLGPALVRGLKRQKRSVLYAEYGKSGPREWTRAQTLALAVAVARRWMARPPGSGGPGERVGILLPPGPMQAVVHLGLYLAGRVPVNLPFTIDPHQCEALARGIAPHRIRTVVTSRAFMPHLMDFWQGDEGAFIDMKALVAPTGSLVAAFERVRAFFEPAAMTAWRLDLAERDPESEAVGLVTKPGEAPLFLGSRELHREVRRVYAANFVRDDDVLFTEDSASSPEGLVLGCWGPALGRGRAVSRSLAQRGELEVLQSALLEQSATLVSGDAAFYGGIAEPLDLASVRYGLLFGPVLPTELRAREETLGLPLCRAWSFAGRILAMSRPDPFVQDAVRHQPQRGRDPQSVGRLLPGLAGKVEHDRLHLKIRPEGAGAAWIEGPRGATIDPDGLVFFDRVDEPATSD